MDLRDSPGEAEFRARLRAWLADNLPKGPPPATLEERYEEMVALHRKLHAAGYMALSMPREWGGQDLGPMEDAIYNEEMARAGAVSVGMLNYVARAILSFGTPEQKERFLVPMVRGDDRWCQGFSEPNAGSDLGGLQTRAVRDGDRFLVSGQKIWTSYAQFADYCFLLARTDPDAPKHKGISVLLVDMRAPGIDVRPIKQSTGAEEFCEVFFDETPVPADHLLGGLNEGWTIAMLTLAYERGPMDIGFTARYGSTVRELARDLVADEVRSGDPLARQSLGRAAVAVEVLRIHTMRSLSRRLSGDDPGSEGSIDKLLMARTDQLLHRTGLELAGASGVAADPTWFDRYLYSRAATIYGGTAQVQRNIVATRVLGMPR